MVDKFKYHKYEIEQFLSEHDFKQVHMVGMISAINGLKRYIEEHYTSLFYMTYDIGYHGWVGEEAKNMRRIDDAITKRITELYAICLAALGDDTDTDDDWISIDDRLPDDMEHVMVLVRFKNGAEKKLRNAAYSQKQGIWLLVDDEIGEYCKHPNARRIVKWRSKKYETNHQ